MNVITPPCPMCKERGVLEDVDALGFVRWSELGREHSGRPATVGRGSA
jgi:hypothetical protein